MNDLISRQSAIDAVHEVFYGFVCGLTDEEELDDTMEALLAANADICTRLKNLPTAVVWNDKWERVKETIAEIRGNNEFENADVATICKFILSYIKVLEEEEENEDND